MKDYSRTPASFEATSAERFPDSPEHLELIRSLRDLYERKGALDERFWRRSSSMRGN